MKKLFLGLTTTFAFALMLGLAVSAYAWQSPQASFPAGNVDAPVNTGAAVQIKSGALGNTDTTLGFFGNWGNFLQLRSGSGCPTSCAVIGTSTDIFDALTSKLVWSGGRGGHFNTIKQGVGVLSDGSFRVEEGTPVAGQVLTAADSLGTVKWANASGTTLPPGTTNDALVYDGTNWIDDQGVLQVGTPSSGVNSNKVTVTAGVGSGSEPLIIDLTHATMNVVGGRNGLQILVSPANIAAHENAGLVTTGYGFTLFSQALNSYGNLAAGNTTVNGNIQITGGNPGAGKVLTSDASGNGSWQSAGSITTTTISPGNGMYAYVRTKVSSDDGKNYAMCPAGYAVTGGGGDCQNGWLRISEPVLQDDWGNNASGGPGTYVSQEDTDNNANAGNSDSANTTFATSPSQLNTGWFVECQTQPGSSIYSGSYADVHAEAICLKEAPIVTGVTFTGPGSNNSNPGGQITPPPSPSGHGLANQSCAAWLGSQYNSGNIEAVETSPNQGVSQTGDCAYEKDTTTTTIVNNHPIYHSETLCSYSSFGTALGNDYYPTSVCNAVNSTGSWNTQTH